MSPCRSLRDPAVTPGFRPPPCPPVRISAGRLSLPRKLGPSEVGVSATAERTPGVARVSASAATGRPGPALVMASWPVRAASHWPVVAWSMVVLPKNMVQDRPTVSTSGVLAEEKRRVAVRRLAAARNPPTGEIAARAGPSSRARAWATTGPKNAAATTRQIALISEVGAAVCGLVVVVATRNSGIAPASASTPPMIRPGPSSRGSAAASVSASVGVTGRPAGGQDREQRDGDSAAHGRGGWQPVVVQDKVRRFDAVAH